MNKSNYGYHMKGSKMRTIMAKWTKNFIYEIPQFSSKIHSYNGVPLGDSENDNRGQIMKTRFLFCKWAMKQAIVAIMTTPVPRIALKIAVL